MSKIKEEICYKTINIKHIAWLVAAMGEALEIK